MRISIITPSFNQAVYLEDTICSVLAQDYPHLEYLIVDGGSTDGSVDIIRRYENQLTWWVSERDNGQAHAINKGLRRATGDIVAWLNSDDFYLPDALFGALAAFQADPDVVLVYGNAISVNALGRPLNRFVFGNWGLDDFLRFRIICQPAVFMRRDAVLEAGLLDESYHFLLDHHLWIRLAQLGNVQHIPLYWAAARQHPQAKNVAHAARFGQEIYRILEWAQTQPDLAARIRQNSRAVWGGAHRLSARYLLDGGAAAQSLWVYLRAFGCAPRYTMQHWHRIVFAILSLVGLRGFGEWLQQRRPERPSDLSADPRLQRWHGLKLPGTPAIARDQTGKSQRVKIKE